MQESQMPTLPASPRLRLPAVNTPGPFEPGNVNLARQPKVRNRDGSISTVDSSSYAFDDGEVLLPSVTPDGRHLSAADDILSEYRRTGRHLGKFNSSDAATNYAIGLHNRYVRGDFER